MLLAYSQLWRALEDLERWQREHLPGGNSPVSRDLVIWLLKQRDSPRSLKDLYRSSRFSEPIVRTALRAFSDAGLIEIHQRDSDQRNRIALITPKLDVALDAYRRLMLNVAEQFRATD